MSLLYSRLDGYEALRFGGLLLGLVITWLLPSAVALVALAVQYLAHTAAMGELGLMVWAASVLLLVSPLLSWLGLVLAAPFVAMLMDRGWFGWIPAIALGLLCGGVMAYLTGDALGLSFGAALLVSLRAILGRLYPAAFELPMPDPSP